MQLTTVRVEIKQLPHAAGLDMPRYMTEHAAGMDIAAAVTDPVTITPGDICLIPTGISVALPPGFELQIRPRSGLAIKHGVTVINSPGTIDADYRGEIKVGLINLGRQGFVIERGQRIAQMVLSKVWQVDWTEVESLPDTKRGRGGFGHTG